MALVSWIVLIVVAIDALIDADAAGLARMLRERGWTVSAPEVP